jgi:Ser/Thr protein kinase RdoA (MazF antagonist)
MTLRKIGEGREAELFAWEAGRILRLYRAGIPRARVEFQAHALKVARGVGLSVPEVFEMVEVDGRQGVVLEEIEGRDLLSALGRQPWRVAEVGRVTALAQVEINTAVAPDVVPELIPTYERILRGAGGVPAAYAAAALQRLEELPRGGSFLHGDFHPGNILMRNGRPVIIDWSSMSSGSAEADVARTRLLLELGEPPPGSPIVVRAAAPFARSILRSAYLRTYRRHRAIDEALLDAWELPVAVVRLVEDVAGERGKLIRYIDGRLTAAAAIGREATRS